MYLARFETETEDWIQAAARIEGVAAPSAGAPWSFVADILSSIAVLPRSTIARRITVGEDRVLRQLVLATAPARFETELRSCVAQLTRLERMLNGTLEVPQRRAERDTWVQEVGLLQHLANAETFSAGGVQLVCDFRLAPILDDLLVRACLGEFALSYQLHVRHVEVEPDWVRAVRKATLAVGNLRGVPPAFLEHQERLAHDFSHASSLVEEYLATDNIPAADMLSPILSDHFKARYANLAFPPSTTSFACDTYRDPLTLGVHRHDLVSLHPASLCGGAINASTRDELLAWRPSPRLTEALAIKPELDESSSEIGHEASDVEVPAPHTGDGHFAFVSYKREDLGRVAPIIHQIRQCGIPVWYDIGIPGGAEWDGVIEERIRSARFVVLFASAASVASKYVRREVKFADALDLPILTIGLEGVAPTHGMDMLLRQYQQLDTRANDFELKLRYALDRLTP